MGAPAKKAASTAAPKAASRAPLQKGSVKRRHLSSRALDMSMPKVLRSAERLSALHREEREKRAKLEQMKLEAERRAGLRV